MYMLGFVLACISFAVVQSNEDCEEPLGMESGLISDEQISASSQWSDSHAASQGRLNFNATTLKAGGWSAGQGDLNKWLQIDLRTLGSEVAFVATQGKNGLRQWVKTYKLQYSNDSVNFRTYSEEGETTDKVFEGNTDSDTVVYHSLNPPIKARFIRFRPITWERHASMRVELYGCQETFRCPICLGSGDNGKNASDNCDIRMRYEVCNQEKPICVTAERFLFMRTWVKRSCSDMVSYDSLKWKFSISLATNRIGFCTESRCMAPFSECDDALGVENGNISDTQISASSEWSDNHAASQGRLNYKATTSKAGGWTAGRKDYNIWLQIDLGNRDTKVTGVATQGGNNNNQWVTKYRLQHSNSDFNFKFYKEQGKGYKIFEGNTNPDTVVYHTLYPPIRARYIRFQPITWEGYASMRVELYGCKETFQCPICYEEGENALTLCNNWSTYEICNKEEPMCKITKKLLFGRVRVSRSCSDKETYDYLKGKLSTSTTNGFCTESRCMAGLPAE